MSKMTRGSNGKDSKELAPAEHKPVDLLAGLSEEQENLIAQVTGLEETDKGDLRLMHWIWNLSEERKDKDGNDISLSPDTFFNTITEEQTKHLILIFVFLKKSRRWSVYDAKAQRRQNICVSHDMVTGRMQKDLRDLKEGQERPCEDCPQSRWRKAVDPTTEEPIRILDCSEENLYVSYDMERQTPCAIRFKRSSLNESKLMLNRFFLRQRITARGRGDYPLYAFKMKVSLKLAENGKFAVPVFERQPLDLDRVVAMAKEAEGFKSYVQPMMEMADAGESSVRETDAEGGEPFDSSRVGPDKAATEAPREPPPAPASADPTGDTW